MAPDLVLLSILTGSNYPCLELIFMVPKVFKPLKFDCSLDTFPTFSLHFNSSYRKLLIKRNLSGTRKFILR